MKYIKNGLNENEKKYFQQFYKNHIVTNDLIEKENSTIIIVEGAWTPFGVARKINNEDYIIIANYSDYSKFFPKNGKIETIEDDYKK